jgi:hypothetical protein
MTTESDSFDLPDDVPEPPAGFDEPVFVDENEPPRYDCLVCDDSYLRPGELREHVEERHDRRDLYTALQPINLPTVAWYATEETPITAYTYEAVQYAQNVLDLEGEPPTPATRFGDDRCPVCGAALPEQTGVPATHPATLAREHQHDIWEIYSELREAVPDEYERSPVYDAGDHPEPAATVDRLQPDDVVAWQAQGWSQSLGTPRGQTRDSISDEDWWEGEGVVQSVEDSRTDAGSLAWEDSLQRTVYLVAQTDLFEDPVEVTLEPVSDGSVTIKLPPQVRQDVVSKRKGHGGAGYVSARIQEADHIDRLRWHERDDK